MSKTSLHELLILKNCLRKCQSILIRRINLCREYDLDCTASETNLKIVKSELTKINKKLKEVLYE